MKYLTVSLLWIAYCVFHSWLISISFTKFISRRLKRYYAFYRLFYVVLSFVLLVPLIRYTDGLKDPAIISYPFPITIILSILMYGSLLLFFWAFFFNYDSLSFFGIRQIMNFLKPAEGEEAVELKKSGLLGLTRHPMYLALIIFLWCQVFTLMDFIINIILTVYVFAGTLLEERKLVMEFGQAYRQYQMEVPMLIPSKRKMTARRI